MSLGTELYLFVYFTCLTINLFGFVYPGVAYLVSYTCVLE